ncbi:MAG: DUF4292 domain-containing protein [Pedobacter sp.]|nr:MAG: DUF4292 domain-containing protein [Pedobacter sp.]
MRKSIVYTIVGIISVALLNSCKPKQLITPSVPPAPVEAPKVDTKVNTLNLLKSKDLVYSTISLRAKANLDVDGAENNVTMQMRIQKDKKIWVSITAIAGIEVARALITSDSIFVRNNLERSYLKKPLSFINKYTNPNVNFTWVQALLTGNTIPELMSTNATVDLDGGVWLIKGAKERLLYQHTFNTLLKISESTLNDAVATQALKVNYGSYAKVGDGAFPMTLQLNTISGNKKINLDLNFTKVDINTDLEFPFSIPKNYSQIQ